MNIGARLKAINDEIDVLRTEARIMAEQIDFQTDVSEDARIRAIVSETPLADRDSREAGDDLARMQRVQADLEARIDALRAEQDKLLERMLEQR